MIPFDAVLTAGRAPVTLDDALVERFRRFIFEADEGHELWTGAKVRGFGHFCVGQLLVDARKVAWALRTRESVPASQLPRSVCGDPYCVRGDHLELVTRSRRGGARRRPRSEVLESAIQRTHPDVPGDRSKGAATIEELTPVTLSAYADAQFGRDRLFVVPVAPAPYSKLSELPDAYGDPKVRKLSDLPKVIEPGQTLDFLPPLEVGWEPTAAEKLAFLRQPGVACITYKSGATLVFHVNEQFMGMTFDEAVAKAIRGHT